MAPSRTQKTNSRANPLSRTNSKTSVDENASIVVESSKFRELRRLPSEGSFIEIKWTRRAGLKRQSTTLSPRCETCGQIFSVEAKRRRHLEVHPIMTRSQDYIGLPPRHNQSAQVLTSNVNNQDDSNTTSSLSTQAMNNEDDDHPTGGSAEIESLSSLGNTDTSLTEQGLPEEANHDDDTKVEDHETLQDVHDTPPAINTQPTRSNSLANLEGPNSNDETDLSGTTNNLEDMIPTQIATQRSVASDRTFSSSFWERSATRLDLTEDFAEEPTTSTSSTDDILAQMTDTGPSKWDYVDEDGFISDDSDY